MNITTTGRTVIGDDLGSGAYYFSIGGAFGGTSVTLDRGNVAGDAWTTLQQVIGTPLTITGETNFITMIPYGDVSVNLTGGAGIDLDVIFTKVG